MDRVKEVGKAERHTRHASVSVFMSLTMSRGNLLFDANDGTKGVELWKLI